MTFIPLAWEADDLSRFDRLLRQHSGPDDAATRSFEWYYWNRRRHGELRNRRAGRRLPGLPGRPFQPRRQMVRRRDGGGRRRRVPPLADGDGCAAADIPADSLQLASVARPSRPRDGEEAVHSDGVQSGQPARGAEPGTVLESGGPGTADEGHRDDGNREIYVWDTEKGNELCHLTLPEVGWFDGLALGPQGKLLAFVSPPPPGKPPSGNVRVWDVDAGKEAFALSTPGSPRELAFSPAGDRLAVALSREGGQGIPDDKNQVQIWDTATRKDPWAIRNDGALPNGVAFCPDGTRLAIVWHWLKGETLALHDAGTGKHIRALEGVVRNDRGVGRGRSSAPTVGS